MTRQSLLSRDHEGGEHEPTTRGYRALVEREHAALEAAAARDAALTPEAARDVLQSWSAMYTERRTERAAQAGPRYHYASGMHLALVLDRADPAWKQRVSDAPEWLVSLARATGATALPAARAK